MESEPSPSCNITSVGASDDGASSNEYSISPGPTGMNGIASGQRLTEVLPELEPLDLTGGGLRQLFQELDPAGILVRCQQLLDVLLQLRGESGAGFVAIFQDDAGERLDESIPILTANDGSLEHTGVAHQSRFNLHG